MSEKRKAGYMEMGMKFGADFWGAGLFPAMVQVKGPLTPELVEKSLELLRERHPTLRAYFSESNKKEDYVELDDEPGKIPLNVMKRTSDDQWKDLMEQNMGKSFADNAHCLWRVDLLKGEDGPGGVHEIIVTFHHSISDGRSAVTFFWDLLDLCSQVAQGKQPEIETLPFLPAMEDMFENKRGWASWISWAVPRYAFYPAFRSAGSMLRYENPVPTPQRKTRSIYREIDREQLTGLAEVCRREKTTLQELLTSAVTLAAYKLVKNQTGKYISSIMTPVDCRRYCKPVVGEDQIGCFIIFAPTLQTVDERTSVWQISRDYNKKLKEAMKTTLTPFNYSKLVAKAYLDSPNHGLFKKKYVMSIPVTNVGRIDRPSKIGPFQINRFNFSVAHDWGDCLMVLYAGTLDDTLYCCFSYQEPLLNRNVADQLVDDTMSIMESAV